MKNDLIVIEKSTLYKMGAAIAVLILLLIGAIYEGIKAGEEANRYFEISETHKAKSDYWHSAYTDLSTSGTCLNRIPEFDKQLAFKSR
jgi:hypothetical protein